MKVLVLAHSYPHAANRTIGGFVHEQVKALREYCEVLVVSPTPFGSSVMRRIKSYWPYYAERPGKTYIEGIEVYHPRYPHTPTKWGLALDAHAMRFALWSLFAKLKTTWDYDLVHAHSICPDGSCAVWLGRRLGTPVVCTIHGSDVNIYPQETCLTRKVTQQAIREANALVTVSAALSEKTRELENPRGVLRVIPNGADLSIFTLQEPDLCREKTGLPRGKRIIVYASRLAEAKGLSELLVAFRRVLQQERDAWLVLLGDGPYRDTLIRETAQLGLGEAVHFVGRKPHSHVAEWMGAADLVVLPSWTEGSPLPVYEALACGRPMVASDVGGIREIITSDDYGLLVPPRDPEALAEGLLRALRREWDAQRIRQHGSRYSWARVARQLVDLYGEVLADQAGCRVPQSQRALG